MKDEPNKIKTSAKANGREKSANDGKESRTNSAGNETLENIENRRDAAGRASDTGISFAIQEDADTEKQPSVEKTRSPNEDALIEHTHFANDTTDAPSRKKTSAPKQNNDNVHLLKIGDKLKEVSPGEFDYRVTEYIGQGGYGQVYKIEDNDHYQFALKLLNLDASDYSFVLEAFKQEVRIARGLYNNGLAKALEHYLDPKRNLHCCIMEYIDGVSLSKVIKYYEKLHQKIDWIHALFIILRVAEVLEYLSANHVVHRDIKPQNIMISTQGVVKVLDLGIARKNDESPLSTDEVPGTLPYIALGQLLYKDPVDVRTDIYSLGVVFYGLLTGRHPYAIPPVGLPFSQRREELIHELSNTPTPDPRDFNPQVPDPVAKIVKKMMSQDVERRYQTAHELIEALRECVGYQQIRKIEEVLGEICKRVKSLTQSNEWYEKTPVHEKKVIGQNGKDKHDTSIAYSKRGSGVIPPANSKPYQVEDVVPPKPEKQASGCDDSPVEEEDISNKQKVIDIITSNSLQFKWGVCVVALLVVLIGFFTIRFFLKKQTSFIENRNSYYKLLSSNNEISSILSTLDKQMTSIGQLAEASPRQAVDLWRKNEAMKKELESFKTDAEALKDAAKNTSIFLIGEKWVKNTDSLWDMERQKQYDSAIAQFKDIHEKLNNNFHEIKHKIDSASPNIQNDIAGLPANQLNDLNKKNKLSEYIDNVTFVKEWYEQLPNDQRPVRSWMSDLNAKTKGYDRWLKWYNSLTDVKNLMKNNTKADEVISIMGNLYDEMDTFSFRDSFMKVYVNVRENLPKDIAKPVVDRISKVVATNMQFINMTVKGIDFKEEIVDDDLNDIRDKMKKSKKMYEVIKGNRQLNNSDIYACEKNLSIMESTSKNLEALFEFYKLNLQYKNDILHWPDAKDGKNAKEQLKEKYKILRTDYSKVVSISKTDKEWTLKEQRSQLMDMWNKLMDDADQIVPLDIREEVKNAGRDSDSNDISANNTYLVINLINGKYRFTDLEPGSSLHSKTTEIWLRRIPAGDFIMGAQENEFGAETEEKPQHQVLLTRDYYMGIYECTQQQWTMVMGEEDNPSFSKGNANPVERVTMTDIRGGRDIAYVSEKSFMGKLRILTENKLAFDLPTEAQWEYACRAGTTKALNSDKDLVSAEGFDEGLDKLGHYKFQKNGEESLGHVIVGQYEPNEWGLYDMHGNVKEWCLDNYSKYEYNTVSNPLSTATNQYGITRGGSWSSKPSECRSASRSKVIPVKSIGDKDRIFDDTGFRIVCPLPLELRKTDSE